MDQKLEVVCLETYGMINFDYLVSLVFCIFTDSLFCPNPASRLARIIQNWYSVSNLHIEKSIVCYLKKIVKKDSHHIFSLKKPWISYTSYMHNHHILILYILYRMTFLFADFSELTFSLIFAFFHILWLAILGRCYHKVEAMSQNINISFSGLGMDWWHYDGIWLLAIFKWWFWSWPNVLKGGKQYKTPCLNKNILDDSLFCKPLLGHSFILSNLLIKKCLL